MSVPQSAGQEGARGPVDSEVVRIGPDGRPVLIGGECRACGVAMFPCACVCHACAEESVEPKPLPRTGALYSYTVLHVGAVHPRAFGYVDLTDGVRVFTRLTGGSFRIGQEVYLIADGDAGYAFTGDAS